MCGSRPTVGPGGSLHVELDWLGRACLRTTESRLDLKIEFFQIGPIRSTKYPDWGVRMANRNGAVRSDFSETRTYLHEYP